MAAEPMQSSGSNASPAEAPAKAALSILGAITAALVAVAVAVSHNFMTTRRALILVTARAVCGRGPFALAQPRRLAPVPPADGAPRAAARYRRRGAYPPLASSRTSPKAGPSTTQAFALQSAASAASTGRKPSRLRALAVDGPRCRFRCSTCRLSATPFSGGAATTT